MFIRIRIPLLELQFIALMSTCSTWTTTLGTGSSAEDACMVGSGRPVAPTSLPLTSVQSCKMSQNFHRLIQSTDSYPMENIKTLGTKEAQTKKFSSLREKLVDGPDLQISRFYDILQLCFCLWGYLKSKVYCPRPNNLNELQAKISNEVAQIDPAMVRRAMMDMKARAVKCIAAGGGHFEK